MIAVIRLLPGRLACSYRVKGARQALTYATTAQASFPRSRLSQLWVPTGGVSATEGETGHGKLIRAGFMRQSQSGIFHLLPLGVRVQDKIAALLEKHMQSLGASRIAMSTITSAEIWRKSGRFSNVASELFQLKDRKNTPLMLSPTHEEEITSLVANTLQSYKDLPLRLYQITRKYRDEKRPRHGLLRSREFVMKDLYSFDISKAGAFETYQQVSAAYRAFFADLKLTVLVAEACSGDMGGDYSHEYHLASHIGEDTIATCSTCGYTANDEVAVGRVPIQSRVGNSPNPQLWRGITKNRQTLIRVWYPQSDTSTDFEELDLHAVKKAIADLDTSIDDPTPYWTNALQRGGHQHLQMVDIVDYRLTDTIGDCQTQLPPSFENFSIPELRHSTVLTTATGEPLNLLRLASGDGCPRCESGTLKIDRALELGHTFYLGTRYSLPLNAKVVVSRNTSEPVFLQMGCYGIGVSRVLGAIAEAKADDRGLNWPRTIAPFEVIVIPTSGVNDDTLKFYDLLAGGTGVTPSFDVVLDDRNEKFGWKMQDADMTGYPVVVILGKAWREAGICEIQCRSLSVKDNVEVSTVPKFIEGLLARL